MKTKPKITKKWNSWDAAGLNILSSAASGMEVTFGFLKEDRCYDQIRNFNLKKVHHYSIVHGYFDYELQIEEAVIGVRVAMQEDLVVVEFRPLKQADDIMVVGTAGGAFGEKVKVKKEGDVLIASPERGGARRLYFVEGDASADRGRLLFPLAKKTSLVLAKGRTGKKSLSAAEAAGHVKLARQIYLDQTAPKNPKKTEYRRLATTSVDLVTIYIPELNEVVCTSTRAWCMGPIWGGYVFFNWDALFLGLLSALGSKELAYANVYAVLNQANENGLIPGGVGKYIVSRDRSTPPLEAWCTLKLYRQFGELAFLKKCYPALKRSWQFYVDHCDGNGDGLYEWYSFPYRMNKQQQEMHDKVSRLLPLGMGTNTLQGAKYSSGMDNSPVFDDAEFDSNSHTLKMADVGLNALLVLTAECLEEMARLLGLRRDSAMFGDFRRQLAARIESELWDEEAGIYKSRFWSGQFNKVLGPMNFYPMMAGIPSKKKARRMVEEHLLSTQEFWGQYVIPTVARNQPSFRDQDYWRGRIWGPTNYLVYAGLERAGFRKTAAAVAEKSVRLFMKEFRKDSHIHEHYNAITGDGDDVNSGEGKLKSDVFYPWGAVLLLPECES